LGYLYGVSGRVDPAHAVLKEFDAHSTSGYVASFDRALVHLGLGASERACRLLADACTEHEPWLPLIRVDPVFDPLRGMPEFEKLVDRIFHEEEEMTTLLGLLLLSPM